MPDEVSNELDIEDVYVMENAHPIMKLVHNASAEAIWAKYASTSIPTTGWEWKYNVATNSASPSFHSGGMSYTSGSMIPYPNQVETHKTYCAYCIAEDMGYVESVAFFQGTTVCAEHIKQLLHIIEEDNIP